MIKDSELRKGNICNHKGKHIVIANVCERGINFEWSAHNESYQYGIPLKDIEPISLTPKLLERCGFEAFDKGTVYVREYHAQGELMLFSTDSPVAQSNGFPPGKFYYTFGGVAHFVDHLHQLQNLFFALTGEELTINEPHDKGY